MASGRVWCIGVNKGHPRCVAIAPLVGQTQLLRFHCLNAAIEGAVASRHKWERSVGRITTLCAGQDPAFALGARRDKILLTQTLMHERRQFIVELTLSIFRWPSLHGQRSGRAQRLLLAATPPLNPSPQLVCVLCDPSAPTDRRTGQVRTTTAASGSALRRMMSKRSCLRYQAVAC